MGHIGFSPDADALVRGNVAWANLEGLLLGHAVGGAAPDGNRVVRNIARANKPADLDGRAGSDNVFRRNFRGGSEPPEICD